MIKLAFNLEEMQNRVTGNDKALNPDIFNPKTGLGVTGSPDVFYIKLIWIFTWTVGILAVIVLIYGGLAYITAGGDAEKSEKGKKAIIGAIIGIVIVMLSYAAYNYSLDALQGNIPDEVQLKE